MWMSLLLTIRIKRVLMNHKKSSKPKHMAPGGLSHTNNKHFSESIEQDMIPVSDYVDENLPSTAQIGRSAAMMSTLVIISRITGFLRTWAQVYAMGVTVVASCYTVANNLPNQLFELVMGGMLVTAFLPVYLSVKKNKGRSGANAYASNLMSIVTLIMGVTCILGIIFASQMVWTQSFSANTEFDHELATYFFKFFAIEIVLYSCSTILSGILNAERDYFWSNAAPIFNNIVVTASFFLYAYFANSNQQLALLFLAVGNPLGVLIQVVMQIPSLRKHNIKLDFHIDWKDPALKETLSIGVPSLLVTIVTFVTVSVQTSSALSVSVAGSSIAYYTRLWYTLPYAIIAVPITTAMFTELSERISSNDTEGYVRGVEKGTLQIIFGLVPCAVLMVIFARPLIVILAAGKLSADDISLTTSYLQMLALSLPFYGVSTYLQKICSSMRKMMVYAVANVVAGIGQVLMCLVMTETFGLNIVALSSLLFFVIVDVVSFVALKKQLPHIKVLSFIKSLGVTTLLSLIGAFCAFVGLFVLRSFIGDEGGSVLKAFIYCAVAGLPSLAIIIAIALKLNIEEAQPFRILINKLFRKA